MAWTAPRTWVANETVTFSLLNTHLRDNLIALNAGALALSGQAAGHWIQASSASQFAVVTPYAAALSINTTAVGNIGLGVDTLQSYALADGTLGTNGWGLEIIAAISFAANGDTKQAWLYFGGTAIAQTTQAVWNNVPCILRATVIRTAAATQVAIGDSLVGTTASVLYTTPAETLSGGAGVTIATKGESQSVADNDIVSRLLMVRLVRTPV